jgi:membrane-bound lytic murein transglycosylase B
MPSAVVLAKRTKTLLAATLAGAALSSGAALQVSPHRTAVAAADIQPPSIESSTSTSTAAEQILGSFEIRPSRIVKVSPSTADPAVVAAPFGPPGAVGEVGIPLLAFQAYKHAEAVVKKETPSCHLPWWLLAGIGHTESGHAESGRLHSDGTTRGRILGPRLNGGIAGDAIIHDTDHGVYDGDTAYDRAVGPMQFIPSTWRSWAVDGNRDKLADPNNIFDATLAAGHYLCAGGRNLATTAGLKAAILSYNHSMPYLQSVLAWAIAYRDHGASVPNSPLPVISDVTKVRPPLSSLPPKPTAPSTSPKHTTGPTNTGPTTTPPTSSNPPTTCPTSSSPTATATETSGATTAESASSSGSASSASGSGSPSSTQSSPTPSHCPS